MVLTRRGAKAIAAPSPSPAPAAHSDSAPASRSASHSASSSTDPDPDPDAVSPKLHARELARRSTISWRLWIGHFCALASVAVLVHAGTQPASLALPWHALALLLCTIPLRTVLAFSVHSLRAPAVRPGMFLALSASVLFASNALHVLATRSLPARLLPLMAAAAVDICAAWLHMTLSAKRPSTEPFVLPKSLLYSAADIYLAAVLARESEVVCRFFWFMAARFVVNSVVLIRCCAAIVAIDEAKKKAPASPR